MSVGCVSVEFLFTILRILLHLHNIILYKNVCVNLHAARTFIGSALVKRFENS